MTTPLPPRVIGAMLVGGQFLLLAVIVLIPTGADWPIPRWVLGCGVALCVGGVVLAIAAALGLGRSLTPMPIPNERNELRTTGLYRWVRHPIYTGLIAFAIGRTIISGNVLTLVACITLVALLFFKSRWEEEHLNRRYPEYEKYARATGRFVPRVTRSTRH